ncbi:MAG: dephospho-CoA kinase [Candidatus Promineifilaceae bacterium]|nr:dephospho-CoA kinase [Candidatus Promineifilaceae bacterium]
MSKQWPNKTIVGLTGNIATGKSAVMRMAAEKGALTLDADQIVHDILEGDASMQAAIAVAFGPDVRRLDGSIDRAALAEIVFSDAEALRDLELMLHPAVRQQIQQRIDESDHEVVMVEAIKLLEGELVELVDEVWVTRCPRRLQIERLMVCRGMDGETAALRVRAQNPQEAKVARADVVIDTDGTMASTQAQFEMAWEQLPRTPDEQATRSRQRRSTPLMPEKTRTPAPQPEPPTPISEVQVPQPEEAPEPEPEMERPTDEEWAEVMVRRARPSDIPAILLLIRRATGVEVGMKRADLLRSFSERSYLIGQEDGDIKVVIGWNTSSTTAVCMDQFYVHPLTAAATVGPGVLDEVEQSAKELICEVALAFPPTDAPEEVTSLLRSAGYARMDTDEMPRAWQETVDEHQPPETEILGKVLRQIRVA